MTPPAHRYTHGHAEPVLRSHRWRTVENSAAYLVPHLRAGARVLDVGCGPGSVTVDLARRVAPGTVLGVDAAEDVVAGARDAAGAAGVDNVDFEVGDALGLGLEDDSFDVVHAHQVLQHLDDPVGALREMARVCRPGGVVAARESDYSGFTWWPVVPELDEWLDLYGTVARSNGGEPDAGRRLKGWALEAGLDVLSATAGVWCHASPEDAAWWGGLWADRIVGSAMAEQVLRDGLATPADLERLARGWRRWAAAPDAWFVLVHGEVVCRPA